jgi:SAM domain (Sterile alpha motif)
MSIDIAEWLRNLGLGQYEASFRDNEIDEAERTLVGIGPPPMTVVRAQCGLKIIQSAENRHDAAAHFPSPANPRNVSSSKV